MVARSSHHRNQAIDVVVWWWCGVVEILSPDNITHWVFYNDPTVIINYHQKDVAATRELYKQFYIILTAGNQEDN